jgi:transposase
VQNSTQLPSDLPSAHQTIITARKDISKLENALSVTKSDLVSAHRENEYLKERLRLMSSKYFGRSSEKRAEDPHPAQVLLFSSPEPEAQGEQKTQEKISYTRKKRKKVEGKLPEGTWFPEHLPRKDEFIDEGEGEFEFVKITERLAANESPFYVKRIIRRIRSNEGSLKSPPVPPSIIEGTSVDISFLVYVLIAKYVWHLPLYRQEQILKSQGITISRDTLIRYVLALASLLKPIYVALGVELFSGEHLFGDETPVLVGKGEHGNKSYTQSWFWTFLGKTGCIFAYTQTRAYKEIEPLIKSYCGDLQCDGYKVYEKLSQEYPEIALVGCWAHARRKFVDAEKGSSAELAGEALRYIGALYDIEAWIQGKKPDEKLRIRQRHSKKILRLFERWLKQKTLDPSLLPKSLFNTALQYTSKRFDTLSRYVENPELAIDSNAVERQIRPVALGKKNWLFCASEAGAEASAIIYSLIASCKLAEVDPSAYLTDVLERISEHPASKIVELLPVNWKATVAAAASSQTAA